MLLGQYFGRCHDGDLHAGVDGLHCGHRGHDGLAAADIALEQTVHRIRKRQIGADFADHPLLRLGQIESQDLHQTGAKGCFAWSDRQDGCLFRTPCLPRGRKR